MNRFIPLLLILLLLCGCAAQNPETEQTELPVPVQTEASPFSGFYDAGSTLEKQSSGALQVFPLEGKDVSGFLPLGEHILLFSAVGSGTELTLLTGDTLLPAGSAMLNFPLTPEDDSLTVCSDSISFFDRQAMQTVVLDPSLQEQRRIPVPADLTGVPVLSSDGNTLYYCTASALRALDLSSGIDRMIKEAAYPKQSVSGLFLEDTVLEISITDQSNSLRTLFLSVSTGQQLAERSDVLTLSSSGDNYYARFYNGASETLLFGRSDGIPRVLIPRNTGSTFFLDNSHAAFTASHPGSSQTVLDYYDLAGGMRRSSITLEGVLQPAMGASAADGTIWFLDCSGSYGCSTLYRWKQEQSQTYDDRLYTGDYYTRQNPDYDGLAACSLYAQEISQRHGVEVLIYKDAAALQPWDYDLEYEYTVPVIQRELELLDTRLSNYPPGFLETLAGKFSGIKICIVREIRGSPESGSVDIAGGIQFWDDYDARIVLAAGHDTDRALYHELCHLIDTVVLTESIAYDQWDSLNPDGFQYAYAISHSLDTEDWLRAGWESFLDNYSMSYPREDRARIMEYAMTDSHADRFLSPYLQAKLRQLCIGIREAFGLESTSEPLLWEQYLQTPLDITE